MYIYIYNHIASNKCHLDRLKKAKEAANGQKDSRWMNFRCPGLGYDGPQQFLPSLPGFPQWVSCGRSHFPHVNIGESLGSGPPGQVLNAMGCSGYSYVPHKLSSIKL